MRKTDLYLTERQHELLKKASQDMGISLSEILRRIVDLYLETKHGK